VSSVLFAELSEPNTNSPQTADKNSIRKTEVNDECLLFINDPRSISINEA
jgi:hypothetical protein